MITHGEFSAELISRKVFKAQGNFRARSRQAEKRIGRAGKAYLVPQQRMCLLDSRMKLNLHHDKKKNPEFPVQKAGETKLKEHLCREIKQWPDCQVASELVHTCGECIPNNSFTFLPVPCTTYTYTSSTCDWVQFPAWELERKISRSDCVIAFLDRNSGLNLGLHSAISDRY